MFFLLFLACQKDFTISLDAPWWMKPDVLLCDTLTTDADKILKGFENFEDISNEYEVNSITYDVNCDDYDDIGFIKIDVVNDETIRSLESETDCEGKCEVLAYTLKKSIYTYVTLSDDVIDIENPPTEVMYFAKVYLKENNNVDTITHEIGHAFGWNHTVEEFGHRMSPFTKSYYHHESEFGLEHYRDLMYYEE
jgi:hypothetical protein